MRGPPGAAPPAEAGGKKKRRGKPEIRLCTLCGSVLGPLKPVPCVMMMTFQAKKIPMKKSFWSKTLGNPMTA